MTRTQSFLMGAAGALALLVVVVGVAWAADIFTIDQNGNVRLVVTDAGRVGIGTSSPQQTLHVVGRVQIEDNTGWPVFVLRGTGAAIPDYDGDTIVEEGVVVPSEKDLGIRRSIRFRRTGSGALEPGTGGIRWGNVNSNDFYLHRPTGAELVLQYIDYTASPDTAANVLTVTSTSRVGVGRSPSANALEIEGDASKTAAGSWLANSDARIKTDVREITDALETIARLRPVKFRYTDDYRARHPSIENRDYENFIAQEFQRVFPECVKDDGTGLLQVDTYNVIPTLVAAVQELVRKNGEMETKIRMLEEKMKGGAR